MVHGCADLILSVDHLAKSRTGSVEVVRNPFHHFVEQAHMDTWKSVESRRTVLGDDGLSEVLR